MRCSNGLCVKVKVCLKHVMQAQRVNARIDLLIFNLGVG